MRSWWQSAGSSLVAGDEGGHRREVPAPGIAADRDPVRVDADLFGVIREPADRREAVVHRGWKGILRRQAVVDRDHHASGFPAEVARHHVVGVEAADDVTAPVEPDEHRPCRPRSVRVAVDANSHRAGRPRYRPVLDAGDGRRRKHLKARPHARRVLRARRLGGEVLDRGQPGRRHLPEEGLNLGIYVVRDHPSAPGCGRRRASATIVRNPAAPCRKDRNRVEVESRQSDVEVSIAVESFTSRGSAISFNRYPPDSFHIPENRTSWSPPR